MISIETNDDSEGLKIFGKHLSMHVAASAPLAINSSEIKKEILDNESKLISEELKNTGKPENIIEKMVDGRMNKFFQENCLIEQAYIKDSEKKVSELLTETIATLGENITISRYVRFAVGESDVSNPKI